MNTNQMTSKDQIPTLPQLRRLHYLITYSEGKYVVHCLDLDLANEHADLQTASRRLDALVKDHIEYSLATGQLQNLNTKAPVSYWKTYDSAEPITLEPKTVQITIPDSAQVVPLDSPAGALSIDARQLPYAA